VRHRCAAPNTIYLVYSSRFLARLETIEVFELAHFVDGLRKIVSILDGIGGGDEPDSAMVSRLVSTGPANICRLWNLRPEGDTDALAKFREEMNTAVSAESDDCDGAFDDAFHHFEVTRNLSAFDATRTRALLDVGQQQTEESLSQLACLMIPPPCVSESFESFISFPVVVSLGFSIRQVTDHDFSPIPRSRPKRPRFRSLKLPICENSNKKSVRLPFLPDHLNSLPIRSHIPYAIIVLNGEPRIMPLSPHQIAELIKVNSMYL
jgi:hypothetical protein